MTGVRKLGASRQDADSLQLLRTDQTALHGLLGDREHERAGQWRSVDGARVQPPSRLHARQWGLSRLQGTGFAVARVPAGVRRPAPQVAHTTG